MLSVISFIFVLGVLIFIHELGHFIVAKRVGIRVDRFSLGFPPNIFTRKWGETEYCIGIIPLGGYVKMAGEHPDEHTRGTPEEFMSKSVGQRAMVIFAGPFMNYLLAILVLGAVLYFTGRPVFDDQRVLVGETVPGDPADRAGIATGDQILAVNGQQVHDFDSLRLRVNAHVGEPIEVSWIHEGDTITADITTVVEEQMNVKGALDSVGVIGIKQKVLRFENYGMLNSLKHGFVGANIWVVEVIRFVKKTVTGEVSAKLIGGPLFIAQQSGKEARKGVASLFYFMAFLSVNLAILNVLPIPVLDGGQLLFLSIERIKGKPLSMKARVVAQQVGIVFLLTLVVMVTYNDIMRFIRGF
ncbi:MAG TPA: RIP metalloprotease RseP [Acidobacteriota bacterium]|nr:RIP metalloprotease RseP [Acidobacteriota bacterium]